MLAHTSSLPHSRAHCTRIAYTTQLKHALYLNLLVYAALSFALTNPQPLAMRESSLVVLQGTWGLLL